MTLKFGEPCTCRKAGNLMSYDPACIVHGVIGPGTIHMYPTTQVCLSCGADVSFTGKCDCDNCDTCHNAGHIEVWDLEPPYLTKKITTWCPHCPEGLVWKELLDG